MPAAAIVFISLLIRIDDIGLKEERRKKRNFKVKVMKSGKWKVERGRGRGR